MKNLHLAGLGLFVALSAVASADLINFDDVASGTDVASQYASVTFTTSSTSVYAFSNFGGLYGSSGTNWMAPGSSSASAAYSSGWTATFTVAVNNLTFKAIAADASGTVADITVNHSGGTANVGLIGFADFNTPVLVDLSAYTDVTSVSVTNVTDPAGLAYDDFSFDPVPEPMTMGLLGLGALVALRRKKRA